MSEKIMSWDEYAAHKRALVNRMQRHWEMHKLAKRILGAARKKGKPRVTKKELVQLAKYTLGKGV